jgi:hypothetical protein
MNLMLKPGQRVLSLENWHNNIIVAEILDIKNGKPWTKIILSNDNFWKLNLEFMLIPGVWKSLPNQSKPV